MKRKFKERDAKKAKEYYAKNKEKIKARVKEYYKTHKEEHYKSSKKPEIRKVRKAYTHQKEIRERKKEYNSIHTPIWHEKFKKTFKMPYSTYRYWKAKGVDIVERTDHGRIIYPTNLTEKDLE